MNNVWMLVLLGVIVGVFSGVMGLGGGTIMVPIMVLLLGMTQQQAHGTSLAVMIPPVTLPAVIQYYMTRNLDGSRNVNVYVALWMALGVLVGAWFGARIANSLPKETLKLIFGFTLIYVAAYTVFGKEHLVRSMLLAGAVAAGAVVLYVVVRWHDQLQA